MTKEEQWIKESIENYIFAYTGKRAKVSDADAQHFTASVMSYLNLCTPSIPSNLDEAAENRVTENGRFEITQFEKMRIEDIKFGAEWMAGQGVVVDAKVCKLIDRAWVTLLDEKKFQNILYDKFNQGDKVVVQIRKK